MENIEIITVNGEQYVYAAPLYNYINKEELDKLKEEEIYHYTLVLKAHIALMEATFGKDCCYKLRIRDCGGICVI